MAALHKVSGFHCVPTAGLGMYELETVFFISGTCLLHSVPLLSFLPSVTSVRKCLVPCVLTTVALAPAFQIGAQMW